MTEETVIGEACALSWTSTGLTNLVFQKPGCTLKIYRTCRFSEGIAVVPAANQSSGNVGAPDVGL